MNNKIKKTFYDQCIYKVIYIDELGEWNRVSIDFKSYNDAREYIDKIKNYYDKMIIEKIYSHRDMQFCYSHGEEFNYDEKINYITIDDYEKNNIIDCEWNELPQQLVEKIDDIKTCFINKDCLNITTVYETEYKVKDLHDLRSCLSDIRFDKHDYEVNQYVTYK